MAQRELLIIREDLILGTLPESDVRELLRLGFFYPNDQYWHVGMSERRDLKDLPPAASEAKANESGTSSWAERARGSMTGAVSAILGTAGEMAGRLKSLASQTPDAITRSTQRLLEDFLPQIRAAVRKVTEGRPVQTIKEGLQDDDFMRKTFGAVYDCLPKPICRFVGEERFITFCLANRNRLIGSDVPGEKESHAPRDSSSDSATLGGS